MISLNGGQNALVLCDMQNDFVHPNGAYARGGATAPAIAGLVPIQKRLADAVRRSGGWVVSTHFTLVPGKGGVPFISDHLRSLRPFLRQGDFVPGAWGHALIDELQPADLAVEKVAFSAFYMSRLDWVLNRAGITHLLFAGIVTNGGVASTVRDAQVRDYHCAVISDGCAAFSDALHEAALAGLKPVATIASADQAIAALDRLA